MKDSLNIFDASPENIWNYKQNHPELVIKDCKYHGGFTQHQLSVIRQSMLCRGINKWLKVRRDLIAYKKQIKHEVKDLMKGVLTAKALMLEKYCTTKQVLSGEKTIYDFSDYTNAKNEYLKLKELLKYKQKVRGDLKAMCMTDRWQIWQGKKLEEMNSIVASD